MATLGSARGCTNWYTPVDSEETCAEKDRGKRKRGKEEGGKKERNGEILFILGGKKRKRWREIRASFTAKSMGRKKTSPSKCN